MTANEQNLVKKYCHNCGWAGDTKSENGYCTQCRTYSLRIKSLEILLPVSFETGQDISEIGQFTNLSAAQIVTISVKIIKEFIKLVAAVVGTMRKG